MKIYLETSVISTLISENNEKMKDSTVKLIDLIKLGIHEGFISDLVYEEIMGAKKEKRKKLFDILRNLKFKMVKTNEEALSLSNKYLGSGLIPKSYKTDSLHIAITVTNNLDAIVSWNLSHIVRERTISGVNRINKEEGYKYILIKTPKEVIE